MGNSASAATKEQNEAASAEALVIFQEAGVEAAQGISLAEWEKVFETLDTNQNGSVTRKDWYIKYDSTMMYDAIPKKHAANIAKAEWSRAFGLLDVDGDGSISLDQWSRRRQVQLSFFPLGMGVYSWGVGVGEDFYEVLSLSRDATEMAVVGPQGIMALGEFADEEGARDQWLGTVQKMLADGGWPGSAWLQEAKEPRSRPEGEWESFEHAGWTMMTDEQIKEWAKEWVQANPRYKAIDAFGRECNEQTFAKAFISRLTDSDYNRMTDNTKGRILVYGGLTLLAGIGIAAATHALRKPAAPQGKQIEEM